MRAVTNITPIPELSSSFLLGDKGKYKHQFANIYFVRLLKLRKEVQQHAQEKWRGVQGSPAFVPRILEVRKGVLSYIIGTVYLDMPLKPNVLEDIAKDHWLIPPAPRTKFNSPEDSIMLEDESGRIKLVGDRLKNFQFVTGVILAALGVETPAGEFEVMDICFAGMAPRLDYTPDSMDIDPSQSTQNGEWIGLLSGLDIGHHTLPADVRIQMLVEYLTSEGGGAEDQESSSQISRLIIAGNSLAAADRYDPIIKMDVKSKKNRRYGYDAATFSPHPTASLSSYLLDLSRSLPVHLLPGYTDPSSATLPQQPLPRAMFGPAKKFEGFRCETNPCWIGLETGCTFLGGAGQTIDDIFKYVESEDRLQMTSDTLRWRHMAPTAPDTLWCYPFFNTDPFIIKNSPHVYFIGNQPEFQTELLEGVGNLPTRVILLPRFSETGILVLVNSKTLEVKTVEFGLPSAWEGDTVSEDA